MPRAYPAEFRRRAIALVEAGQGVAKTAADLGITDSALYLWVKKDRIDCGLMPSRTTVESKELRGTQTQFPVWAKFTTNFQRLIRCSRRCKSTATS